MDQTQHSAECKVTATSSLHGPQNHVEQPNHCEPRSLQPSCVQASPAELGKLSTNNCLRRGCFALLPVDKERRLPPTALHGLSQQDIPIVGVREHLGERDAETTGLHAIQIPILLARLLGLFAYRMHQRVI